MRVERIRELACGPFARTPALPRHWRARLHRMAGADIDATATFGPRVFVRDPFRLTVGPGSWVGPECYFESHADVTLGRNVSLGARCVLLTASHEIGPASKRAGNWYAKPIHIEDGAWLGASVTVLPGITIGRGCIIAAGSTVIADCEPNALYAGTPAMVRRQLGT